MKTNLKENIWIEGFDTNQQIYNFKDNICFAGEPVPYLWMGKTSEIPEDVAKKCVLPPVNGYRNYANMWINVNTAKESIQSACSQEYCIIYKI